MKAKIPFLLFLSLNLILCASSQKKIEQTREKSPRYQYNLGLFYLNDGQVDEAIKYFNKSLAIEPKYDLSLNALGLAYSMKGNFEESVKYFQKCLAINPALTEAHNNLGSIYQEMGLLDKAEQEFRAAITDRNYTSRELPYYNLARLYMLQDKLQDALNFADKALEINRSMVMAHNLRGIIFEKLNNYSEAVESYKQALRTAPDDQSIQFNLAAAYFKNNEFQNSKEIFDKLYAKTGDQDMKKKIEEYLNVINK